MFAAGVEPITLYPGTTQPRCSLFNDRRDRMVYGTDQVKSALDICVEDMGLVLDAAREGSYLVRLACAAEQL